MKMQVSTLSFLAAAFLLLNGCQERMPLELTADQLPGDLEVLSLQPWIESALSRSTVDTTGILNTEESKYFATLFVSGVKYDVGGNQHTISYSKVKFRDKNQPVEYGGRRLTYRGIDVGRVQIDGIEMEKVQRLIHSPDFAPDFAVGPQYILANRDGTGARDFNFRPDSPFEWKVEGTPSINPFSVTVRSPDDLTITTPKSNSIIVRDEDLRVKWKGKAESLRLIISGIKGTDFQPFLQINLIKSGGEVIIPSKILALLPTEAFQTYVFSFISFKESKLHVKEFPEEIFSVALSVHNIVLTVL